MTREVPTTGAHLQAEVDMRGKGGTRAAVQVMVAVALFIVLAGIWACLWVPPSRGF